MALGTPVHREPFQRQGIGAPTGPRGFPGRGSAGLQPPPPGLQFNSRFFEPGSRFEEARAQAPQLDSGSKPFKAGGGPSKKSPGTNKDRQELLGLLEILRDRLGMGARPGFNQNFTGFTRSQP